MGFGKSFLLAMRVLALMASLAVVGLGVRSKFIDHDIDARGDAILKAARLAPDMQRLWQMYFRAVADGVVRSWITIATAAFASLAGLIIVLASMIESMRMPTAILVPLECLCMCALAASVGTALSFLLGIHSFSKIGLDASNSRDLKMFAMLPDLTEAYTIVAGAACFIFLVTFITATAQACSRLRDKESCSFEPTASNLGIGHSYADITVPSASHGRIPSMYDPEVPLISNDEKAGKPYGQDQGSAGNDLEMGRVDSATSEDGRASLESQKEVTGPLNLEKPERVLQIRPSRPWSEAPKKRANDIIHAM